jgi:hypothetical protein
MEELDSLIASVSKINVITRAQRIKLLLHLSTRDDVQYITQIGDALVFKLHATCEYNVVVK